MLFVLLGLLLIGLLRLLGLDPCCNWGSSSPPNNRHRRASSDKGILGRDSYLVPVSLEYCFFVQQYYDFYYQAMDIPTGLLFSDISKKDSCEVLRSSNIAGVNSIMRRPSEDAGTPRA